MSENIMDRHQVREYDRRAIEEIGVPGVVLMENAGRGCSEILKGMCDSMGVVVIFCGPGNNGGDGYVIARHLDILGIETRIVLLCERERIKGDAAINLHIIEKMGLDIRQIDAGDGAKVSSMLSGASVIVDAIFGTGLRGAIEQQYLPVIQIINAMPNTVFSVDIPSGLDCDTGMPLGDTIEANVTATFVANKQGFQNVDSKKYTGNVVVVNIGI